MVIPAKREEAELTVSLFIRQADKVLQNSILTCEQQKVLMVPKLLLTSCLRDITDL